MGVLQPTLMTDMTQKKTFQQRTEDEGQTIRVILFCLNKQVDVINIFLSPGLGNLGRGMSLLG